ncbi:SCO2102 family sporulation regulator [Streptomyces griseoluteus]|uniref:SCO2102 family sporulation regulator n=1 Tax=Streptomyces griseoluteus TaxID=29306 RepID=UPI00341340BE
MGWTVLYIAFGIVALWLLGEVLLQYKARLRWRLLAFTGFLGVVVGVLMPSVVVIGLGAIAFAVGQTYVTLSFRKGFAAGWAVKRPDDEEAGPVTRRRRNRAEHQDPVLGDTGPDDSGDLGHGHPGPETAAYATDGYDHDDAYDRDDVFTPARPDSAAETTSVYEPQPMPDDTGSYGVYGDGTPAQPQQTDQAYAYDYSGYGQQGGYAPSGYDTGAQQAYPGYTDPYGQGYEGGYDNSGYAQQGYAQQSYGQDAYGGQGETPAGGVWVPQQRTDETYNGELPPEQQQYPYQGQSQQQNTGYDEQYRY